MPLFKRFLYACHDVYVHEGEKLGFPCTGISMDSVGKNLFIHSSVHHFCHACIKLCILNPDIDTLKKLGL